MYILPYLLTVDWARKFITYLGGDPTPVQDNWCWKDFIQQYPNLLKPIEDLVSTATTGDPARIAYLMFFDFVSSREWTQSVIERAIIGDPAYFAYRMCRLKSNREWAEGVIEKATTGEPSWAGYYMYRDFGSQLEWLKKVISMDTYSSQPEKVMLQLNYILRKRNK